MSIKPTITLSHVAEMLGEDEDWLFEVAEGMDTEYCELWVADVGEEGVMASSPMKGLRTSKS